MLARPRRVPPPAFLDGAIALALAGAAVVLYAPVLRLWWSHDDVFHLRTLLTYRPYWYLWSAADYQLMPSGRLFTPLLFLSLDLDRRWFGIDPRPFQLHQLTALGLCAVTFYGAARQWLARPWAAVAASLFLVGPVTGAMASLLMVRHYQESLVLAALAVTAWAAALRRWPGAGAWRWAWLSAALYLAASLAKEIAVPLVALLPLLPSPGPPVGLRARARLALPHVTACAVYLAMRLALVSRPFDTYGFIVTVSDLPALGLALPGKIVRELAGGSLSFAAVLLAATLAAGLAGLAVAPSRRRAVATTGLALLLATLPVLPVSTVMEPRYAVASWVVVVVAFALGCRALAAHGAGARRRFGAAAIALVACAAGLWLNREDWRVRFAVAERISAENLRVAYESPAGWVTYSPALSLRLVDGWTLGWSRP